MKVNLQLQELLIFLNGCDFQSLFVFVFVLIQFARSKPRRSKSPNENIFANKTKLFEKVRGVHEREAKKETSVSSNLCNQAENLSFLFWLSIVFFLAYKPTLGMCNLGSLWSLSLDFSNRVWRGQLSCPRSFLWRLLWFLLFVGDTDKPEFPFSEKGKPK